MATVSAAWLGWLASRRRGAPIAVTWALLAVVASSGGFLVAYAPVAIGFVAVAALGAGVAFESRAAVGIGVVGVAAVVVSVAVLTSPYGGEVIAEGIFTAAAGLMAGSSRRQYERRAEQAEQLLSERVMQRGTEPPPSLSGTVLAARSTTCWRTRSARSRVSGGCGSARAGRRRRHGPGTVQRARRLAVDGLNETRQAVRVLRDEPLEELVEQLTALAEREGAPVMVTGRARPLPAEHGLALYRAAQEALSNARKHAPGARVSVRLGFEPRATRLVSRTTRSTATRHWPSSAGPAVATAFAAARTVESARRSIHAAADLVADRRGLGAGVKVLVVDDQAAVREGLELLLGTLPGIDVVGTAEDGATAVSLVEQAEPDVVLMDLRMPGVDGIEATRQIRERHPRVQVVVLTTYADDESILGALQAGAIGFLTKDAGRDDLARAIAAAAAGQGVLDAAVQAQRVAQRRCARRPGGALPDGLTEREGDVLRLIAGGLTNAEIAERLFVSRATVNAREPHLHEDRLA